MVSRKFSRTPNRHMNRVWIGLYANRIRNIRSRKVWKGAKGFMAMWGVQKKEMPLLNMLIAPVGCIVYTDEHCWTWEAPHNNYPVITEDHGKL